MNLYTDYAEEFSKTRQSPWPGWERVMSQIQTQRQTQKQGREQEQENDKLQIANVETSKHNLKFEIGNLKVLDLGSGNGRFLKYLLSENIPIEEYVGVDNSDILLRIARKSVYELASLRVSGLVKGRRSQVEDQKLEDNNSEIWDMRHETNIKFIKSDLNKSEDLKTKLDGKFDLIVAFGLIHHIETFESRRRFFEETKFLLKDGGIFAIAFWQFPFMKRFSNRMSKVTDQKSQDLHETLDLRLETKFSDQDYILPFGKNAKRFCHYCSTEEIAELEKGLDFKVLDEYYEDGKEGNQNYYKLYKK